LRFKKDIYGFQFSFFDLKDNDFIFGKYGRFENLVDTITTLLIGDCLLRIDNCIVDCWLRVADWKKTKKQTTNSKKQLTLLIGDCLLRIDNCIVDCWLQVADWKKTKKQTTNSKKQLTIEINQAIRQSVNYNIFLLLKLYLFFIINKN
jgi:hypothetical protein